MADFKKSLIGSFIYLLDGIGQRIVGVISTMILARILVPEDFGIVAIATLALNFLEVLSKNNSGQIIETQEGSGTEIIDIIFTINFFQKLIVSVLFFLVSPALSNFFAMKDLELVFKIISVVLFFVGLTNPMLPIMKKKQMYKKIILANFLSKLITTFITIILAVELKNYWALIIGQSLSYILPIVAGYVVMPYMPKFSVGDKNSFSLVFKYTCVTVPNEIFGYLRTQVDVIAASKLFSVDSLGGFHMVKYYSIIPIHYFLAPMFEPLLVQLSSVRNNISYYRSMCNVSLITYLAIALPVTVFMFSNSAEIINAILGENWIKFSDIFALCCAGSFITGLLGVASKIFIIENEIRKLANFNFISLILLLLSFGIYYFYFKPSLSEFIIIKISVDLLAVIYALIYVYLNYLGAKSFASFFCVSLILLLFNFLANGFSGFFIGDSGLFSLVYKFLIFCTLYIVMNISFVMLVRTNFDEIIYLRGKLSNFLQKNRDIK